MGHATADDATSEAFVTAWRRLEDAEAPFERAWLFGIARNVIRNTWRSSLRASRTVEKIGSLRGTSPGQPDELASTWVDSAAIRSLRRLSHRDQEILMLSAWDGLTGEEIATVLGIAPNAVHQRLHRAKKRLAAQMNEIATADEGGV